MKEDHQLLHPLLSPATAAAAVGTTNTTYHFVDVYGDDNTKVIISSNPKIILRLLLVLFVGILSLWANHEASKGFHIHVKNDAADSAAGRRFEIFYVSDDKATRLVLEASKFVEALLYPNNTQPKKQVNRVTLRLAGQNLTHIFTVESFKENEFVLQISPSTMEETNDDGGTMLRAVRHGMARIWTYDNAPESLINGMVVYISNLTGSGDVSDSDGRRNVKAKMKKNSYSAFAGGRNPPEPESLCWKEENPIAMAHFLGYCEEHKRGFIQRLNQGLKGKWHDRTVEDALGMPTQQLCGSYLSRK